MFKTNYTEETTAEAHEQWIIAGAILAYSLAFFVVILRHHVAAAFSFCSPCNLLVQSTQYIRGKWDCDLCLLQFIEQNENYTLFFKYEFLPV